MSIAKATVTGIVSRTPEKRYTQNGVAVYSFTLNIDSTEESLIRVVSKRTSLSDVLDRTKRGNRLLIDGRLQVAVAKAPDGTERKCFEIDANDIELLTGSANSASTDFGEIEISQSSTFEELPTFSGDTEISQTSASEELPTFSGEPELTEDSLMPEDEIPF